MQILPDIFKYFKVTKPKRRRAVSSKKVKTWVLDDQKLDYDTQKELLQIMFNLDIDKIQRVFVGNKKGYVIKD